MLINLFFCMTLVILIMTTSDYATYGSPIALTKELIDPVEQCVGNNFFTKTGRPGINQEIGLCQKFMGKRCAANNWDVYCDYFLYTGETDTGGFHHLNRKFLETAAKEKFCRAATEAPGAQCAMSCEPFDPTSQASPQVCSWVGTQNWMDTKAEYDLAGNYLQTQTLNPVSPTFMNRCPLVCDAKGISEISEDDAIINKCIDHGACGDTLLELAYYITKNGIPVNNTKFKKFIDLAKLDKPFNPNVVSRIAKNYGIPASDALELLQNPPSPEPSPPVAKQLSGPPSGPPMLPKVISVSVPMAAPMVSVKEGYIPSVHKGKINYKQVFATIGIVLLCIAIIFFIIKFSKN